MDGIENNNSPAENEVMNSTRNKLKKLKMEVVKSGNIADDTRTGKELLAEVKQPKNDGEYLVFSSKDAWLKWTDWWKNFEPNPDNIEKFKVDQETAKVLPSGEFAIKIFAPSRQAKENYDLLMMDVKALKEKLAAAKKEITELERYAQAENVQVNIRNDYIIVIEESDARVSQIPPVVQQQMVDTLYPLGYQVHFPVRNDVANTGERDLYLLATEAVNFDYDIWKKFVRLADDAKGDLKSVQWNEETMKKYELDEKSVSYMKKNQSVMLRAYSENIQHLLELKDHLVVDADQAEVNEVEAYKKVNALELKMQQYEKRIKALGG